MAMIHGAARRGLVVASREDGWLRARLEGPGARLVDVASALPLAVGDRVALLETEAGFVAVRAESGTRQPMEVIRDHG